MKIFLLVLSGCIAVTAKVDTIQEDVLRALRMGMGMSSMSSKNGNTKSPSRKSGKGGGSMKDDYSTTNCTVNANEPVCSVYRAKKSKKLDTSTTGLWVCRYFTHPKTLETSNYSACIEPGNGLETDTCGCCDGQCPEMCPCVCDPEENDLIDEGVWVTMTSRSGKKAYQACIDASLATTLLASHDNTTSCVTTCP
jgi:hypothetical protein